MQPQTKLLLWMLLIICCRIIHITGALSIASQRAQSIGVLWSEEFDSVSEDLVTQLNAEKISDLRSSSERLSHVLTVEPFGEDDYAIGLCQPNPSGSSYTKPHVVDFCPPSSSRQGKRAKQKDLLLQAIGKQSSVIDATAGWGGDAWIMAHHHSVHMVERNPLIAILLRDALRRIQSSSLAENLQLTVGDFAKTSMRPTPVVYLDPMFPPRKKKAKVKKDMQILHSLLKEETENHDELFAVATRVATSRVVVKRPVHAPWLTNKKPSFTVSGPTNRWDVYLR